MLVLQGLRTIFLGFVCLSLLCVSCSTVSPDRRDPRQVKSYISPIQIEMQKSQLFSLVEGELALG